MWVLFLHLTNIFVSLDGQSDGQRADAVVVINIQDVNDDPPAFSPVKMLIQNSHFLNLLTRLFISQVQSGSL